LIPSSDENLRRYASSDYQPAGRERGAVYHADRIKELLNRCGRDARLLEIGCGTGEFSETAAKAGLDVTAIEPGALFQAARSRLGSRVHQTSWERYLEDDVGEFDAIVAWEVVEHLIDPREFVAAAASRLRSGGLLAISTPNAESWSVRLLGSNDPMLCADEHLRIFSVDGLRSLLSGTFSRDVQIRGFGYLLPDEVASGLGRLWRGHRPPQPLLGIGSWATRLVSRSRLGLGLEAYLETPSPAG
jgi:SAM-dependent methyltransferase